MLVGAFNKKNVVCRHLFAAMALLTLAGAFLGPFHNLVALACAEKYRTFDYIQHQTQISRDTLRFVLHDLKRTGLVSTKVVHGEMYKSKTFRTESDITRIRWAVPPSKDQLRTACELAGVVQTGQP